jgi:hypothetical protein
MISQTVLVACLFYFIGIGIVLYIRPTSMFRPGGVWREFGLSNSEHHTLFPFWMFALVWSLFSYAFATLCLSITLRAEPSGLEIISDPMIQQTPVSAPTEPGYYILKPATIESTGANYVYYGTTPPPPQEIDSFIQQRR